MKCFRAYNVILFLNDLIVKLINEECLKERNEKLILMSKKRNVNKNKNKNKMYTYCKKAVHSENNY